MSQGQSVQMMKQAFTLANNIEIDSNRGRDKSQGVLNTVATPNFVSSYRLQPVVNDSDLLSGRDFVPLTHRIDRPISKNNHVGGNDYPTLPQ